LRNEFRPAENGAIGKSGENGDGLDTCIAGHEIRARMTDDPGRNQCGWTVAELRGELLLDCEIAIDGCARRYSEREFSAEERRTRAGEEEYGTARGDNFADIETCIFDRSG
jgi:hypothetical protein